LLVGKVVIDGDIVAYRAAISAEKDFVDVAIQKADDLMEDIISETCAFPEPRSYVVYLTGKNNFRYNIAKTAVYKGNRKDRPKPRHLQAVRDFLSMSYDATISEGEEADDLISKTVAFLGPSTVVASIDKDMLQLACHHYNFVKGEWSQVDEWGGMKFFYAQILTGDVADNIKGIKGIGPVKAGKLLGDCSTEEELWYVCLDAYEGDYDRVVENARLLWLRRREGELWEPPTVRDGDTQ
jgi:5'-3' exonuclease